MSKTSKKKEEDNPKKSKTTKIDKKDLCYCPHCGTKNNKKNKKCTSCKKKLKEMDEHLFALLMDKISGEVIDRVSSYLVTFIKAHLYGVVMSVSLISMVATNIILNNYNKEHITEQTPSVYYNALDEKVEEKTPQKEEETPPVEEVKEEKTPSPEPVVSEPAPAPVETSCTPKQFAHPYTYVYESNDVCTNEGYSAFDYVSSNVNSRVFVFGCDEIVDSCGTTWYGVYYLVHNSETDQNEKFYY